MSDEIGKRLVALSNRYEERIDDYIYFRFGRQLAKYGEKLDRRKSKRSD
jgi:hypothetical protein